MSLKEPVKSFYQFDGLGSVIALSDPNGDTVQTYEYSVYGEVAASDVNHPNPIMFTGRWFDQETGLYYYRARYYHPSIGRFLQTDPVGYSAGMNLYRYCGNNPLGFADPSGSVPIAFYNGSAKKYDTDRDGRLDSAWGPDFISETADSYFAKRAWDMGPDPNRPWLTPKERLRRRLAGMKREGIINKVTDVYFYDHCDWRGGQFGLFFGEEWFTGEALKDLLAMLGSYLPSGATLHFRHCYVALDRTFLEDLAKWSGRKVTGCTGPVVPTWGGSEDTPGPRYILKGDLWTADPNPAVPSQPSWGQWDAVSLDNPAPH